MRRNLGIALLCLPAALAWSQNEGWKPLFNGRDLEGWHWSVEEPAPQPCWVADSGVLRTTPDAGKRVYLLTREAFSDFELSFEWKAEAGANSGVKYRFQGYWVDGKPASDPGGSERIEPIALEYQLTDDERHPDALSGETHATAAVYEYWPATKTASAKAEVWHTSRIVARGFHIEHWLDGRRVVNIDLDSVPVQQAFARSRRKGSSPLLARHARRNSPIALQFHDGVVSFRNIRIRSL